jgi:hypothetical protein
MNKKHAINLLRKCVKKLHDLKLYQIEHIDKIVFV